MHYYPYLILDIYSRDIMACEVWEEESEKNASRLIRKVVISQGLQRHKEPLILHSDNGSPMNGTAMSIITATWGLLHHGNYTKVWQKKSLKKDDKFMKLQN